MDRPRTTFTLTEAAWLHQVSEDAFYRRCRRGRVTYAFQIGRTWVVECADLRRRLPRLAAELAHALAGGDISIVRAASRSAAPVPLSVYRLVSDRATESHARPQGDEKACIPESDTIAHLRTEASGKPVA